MNKKDQKFGVLVLAAGNSERMGNPKALLPYNKQLLFYEKIVQEYQKANTDEIVLVCQPEVKNIIEHKAFYLTNNFNLLENREPNKGRMHSILLGLKSMKLSNIFIHNVDNPFVSNSIFEAMKSALNPGSYVCPSYQNKGGHPILLSNELVSNFLELVLNSDDMLRNVLTQFPKIDLCVDNPSVLININSPHDFKKYVKNR